MRSYDTALAVGTVYKSCRTTFSCTAHLFFLVDQFECRASAIKHPLSLGFYDHCVLDWLLYLSIALCQKRDGPSCLGGTRSTGLTELGGLRCRLPAVLGRPLFSAGRQLCLLVLSRDMAGTARGDGLLVHDRSPLGGNEVSAPSSSSTTSWGGGGVEW